jgi:drug/metabolite transporter (DMT)-like permease
MSDRAAPSAPRPLVVAGLVALLCLCWGSTWWAIRVCLADQPPLWSAGLRFAIAGLALAALVAAAGPRDAKPPPPIWLWLVAGATSFAGSYGILYVAEQTVPSGLAAVLWSVFPLLMAISGVCILDERLRPLQMLGFVVSFVGIAVVFLGTGDGAGQAPLADCLFLLASPVVSAIGTTLIKKYGGACSSLRLNRNGMLFGACLLLATAALCEPFAAIRWTPAGAAALLYLGLCGTALTFGVYFWLLQRVAASRLSLISYVTPVLAVLIAALVGDGDTGVTLWLGTFVVCAGVALVVWREHS